MFAAYLPEPRIPTVYLKHNNKLLCSSFQFFNFFTVREMFINLKCFRKVNITNSLLRVLQQLYKISNNNISFQLKKRKITILFLFDFVEHSCIDIGGLKDKK